MPKLRIEVYAAYLAYTDSGIGRLIETDRHIGKLDNTLTPYQRRQRRRRRRVWRSAQDTTGRGPPRWPPAISMGSAGPAPGS
jgi:hypothetical protein